MPVHPRQPFGIGATPIRATTLTYPNARFRGSKLFSSAWVEPRPLRRGVKPCPSSRITRFRTEAMVSEDRGCPVLPECPSSSVHARVRCLQAIDREEAGVDCPHRPAAGRDPELLAVGRATELLSRSTCRTRLESAATPQAASIQNGIVSRFKRCDNRCDTVVRANYGLVRQYECGVHRFRDRPFDWFIEDIRVILHDDIIRIGNRCCNSYHWPRI